VKRPEHRQSQSKAIPTKHCIWCKRVSKDKDIEHVFPAALGCPDEISLPGEVVCKACNNRLSKLDLAVCDEFDLFAFFSGVPRRGGKPPQVLNRGNLIATFEPAGPTISINMGSTPSASHTNKPLGAYGGTKRNIKSTIVINGRQATVSGYALFGQGRHFLRGLVKIAFSSFTYHFGAQAASSNLFDPVRDFVLHGKGSRHVIVTQGIDKEYRLTSYGPFIVEDGSHYVEFRIACFHFLVDLSPDESTFPRLLQGVKDQYGSANFFVLPSTNA